MVVIEPVLVEKDYTPFANTMPKKAAGGEPLVAKSPTKEVNKKEGD